MHAFARDLHRFVELLRAIAWKSIALRYKQAYFGVAWVALKPIVMVLIFMLVRSFVGIDSGDVPYPLLAYCALLPWIFFQESAADSTGSVVSHSVLIRKIYLPSEVFPLAAVLTKTVDLAIGLTILVVLMWWYDYSFHVTMLWAPVMLVLSAAASMVFGFAGSALNVYYRDVSQVVPLMLSLAMYASPVMYPLELVRRKLVEEQAAGSWSDALYLVYTINPLTGIIDGFQRIMLMGLDPNWETLAPGLTLIAVALPLSYLVFRRAAGYFADFI